MHIYFVLGLHQTTPKLSTPNDYYFRKDNRTVITYIYIYSTEGIRVSNEPFTVLLAELSLTALAGLVLARFEQAQALASNKS